MGHAPGTIRDAIVGYLSLLQGEASVSEISKAVSARVGNTSASSIRSYLNLNVPELFERTQRGHYRLRAVSQSGNVHFVKLEPAVRHEKATLYHADCFDWLAMAESNSIHAVVTDPPYGVAEYSQKELKKLRKGQGGIWRIPPSFDGHKRAPLPRFTVLSDQDRSTLQAFFTRFGTLLARVLVPGGNVVIASNPLLSHLVAAGMAEGGFEIRGYLARLTMTMRGGDRPKNAHEEFSGVSVMPRSQWEPWVVLRKPLDGRAQDNLRKWKVGGFRRLSDNKPFGDVIRSNPTQKIERVIAPHPSLKPQEFLRSVVRASLPLGEGIVLDPFAGSGSTLAAANAVGYRSIGVEADPKFVRLAGKALPKLSALKLVDPI